MKKILVIQNKRIGDVLLSSVIANNIKQVFPQSEVTYFVYDYTSGVLENNPNIDHIIKVQEKELKKLGKLRKMISTIRKERYDIIFDPYAKFQSKMICLFSKAEYRIGFVRKNKGQKLPFYTHPVELKQKSSTIAGRAINDRINLVNSVFPIAQIDEVPKIFLTEDEKRYSKTDNLSKPVIMLGVLGSVPKKSLSYPTIAAIIDAITSKHKATILFNYAPHQKEQALKIFELCKHKNQINLDIYEDSIRGFATLINKCDMLIANEGGSVHIAKALDVPTFTIYSPYIDKDAWNSFEDGKTHQSIHLLEEKPELFDSFTREETKKIEENPELLYQQLTPEMILGKLEPYLENHLD